MALQISSGLRYLFTCKFFLALLKIFVGSAEEYFKNIHQHVDDIVSVLGEKLNAVVLKLASEIAANLFFYENPSIFLSSSGHLTKEVCHRLK